MCEETKYKYAGIPMTEEKLKEHIKAFADIDESVKALDKKRNKVQNKKARVKQSSI